MAGISVAKASEFFTKCKNATKWAPKPCPNGTQITYINKGNNGIEKLVERANGTKIRSTFQDGKLLSTLEENSKGVIEHYFGATNYNRIIKVDTNRGESLCRLGNKGKPGFIDTNYNFAGRNISAQGNFSKELKIAMDFVRANNAQHAYSSKYDDILNKLRTEWALKPPVAQNNESSFEKFIRKCVK